MGPGSPSRPKLGAQGVGKGRGAADQRRELGEHLSAGRQAGLAATDTNAGRGRAGSCPEPGCQPQLCTWLRFLRSRQSERPPAGLGRGVHAHPSQPQPQAPALGPARGPGHRAGRGPGGPGVPGPLAARVPGHACLSQCPEPVQLRQRQEWGPAPAAAAAAASAAAGAGPGRRPAAAGSTAQEPAAEPAGGWAGPGRLLGLRAAQLVGRHCGGQE